MPSGSQCQNCRHYYGALRCEAYPETPIPTDFITGEAEHNTEQPDQVPGYLFEYVAAGNRQPFTLSIPD